MNSGLHLASMVHEYVVTKEPSVMVYNFYILPPFMISIALYIIGSDMGYSGSTGHDDCLHRKAWLCGRFTGHSKYALFTLLFSPGLLGWPRILPMLPTTQTTLEG